MNGPHREGWSVAAGGQGGRVQQGSGQLGVSYAATPGHALFGHLFALLAVCVVYGCRLLLLPIVGPAGPLLMFQSPVILSALFYGTGPGLTATICGGALASYYFIGPPNSFVFDLSPDLIRVGVFAAEGVLISILGGLHRQKKLRLADALVYASQAFSEREKAAHNARRLEAELAQIWRVNTMGEMAASLAHQLGHPIISIINYAQALRRMCTAGKQETVVTDTITEIAHEAQRAAAYINSLRSFVKHRKPSLKNDKINAIVLEITGLIAHEFKKNEVTLKLDLDPRNHSVVVDRVQLEQVILNLLRNSIESMLEGTRRPRTLLVKTMLVDQTQVGVTVIDSGCGISQENLARVFEPFYSNKASGMGMGLAICRSMIEAHSGKLSVTSDEGVGSQFHFTLPLAGGETL